MPCKYGARYGLGVKVRCKGWSLSLSKKQYTLSKSSTDAEYKYLSSAACEIIWIQKLLFDLKTKVTLPVDLFYDNKSALQLAVNPIFHERSNHFEIDVHFIREKIAKGILNTKKICSSNQIADILTKHLPVHQHKFLCEKLATEAEHIDNEHDQLISEPEPDVNDNEAEKHETLSNDKEKEQEDNEIRSIESKKKQKGKKETVLTKRKIQNVGGKKTTKDKKKLLKIKDNNQRMLITGGTCILITPKMINEMLGIPMGSIAVTELLYVNATISKQVTVEEQTPLMKSWDIMMLKRREKEELNMGGFGRLRVKEAYQYVEKPRKQRLTKGAIRMMKNSLAKVQGDILRHVYTLKVNLEDIVFGVVEGSDMIEAIKQF
ncbi:hypothetical protein Tco_0951299 [Tanacetum coccineum]|uniref:Copia protein n=1 Tax=Tanacetum coccineum TaxID=301880 RepID=A0ABQ5DZS2_9ASTR